MKHTRRSLFGIVAALGAVLVLPRVRKREFGPESEYCQTLGTFSDARMWMYEIDASTGPGGRVTEIRPCLAPPYLGPQCMYNEETAYKGCRREA